MGISAANCMAYGFNKVQYDGSSDVPVHISAALVHERLLSTGEYLPT